MTQSLKQTGNRTVKLKTGKQTVFSVFVTLSIYIERESGRDKEREREGETKSIPNSMPKKYRKMIAKSSEQGTKMIEKLMNNKTIKQ